MSADTLPAFLTIKEVAEQLRVHPQSVYRLIWAKKLGYNNVGTAKRPRIRVSRKAFDAYAKATERP